MDHYKDEITEQILVKKLLLKGNNTLHTHKLQG
jgi:hypothetical protein